MAKKKNLPLDDVSQKRLNLSVPGEEPAPQLSFPTEPEPEKEVHQEPSFIENPLHEESLEEAVSGVGDQLRIARERKGLSAHEMAEQLRLRPTQILALEKGAYDELPGQAFVTGFLRSYANALGLDAVNIVRLYRLEHDGKLGAPELAFPEPTSEGKMPGGTLIISTCLVALLAFGGWYYYQLESKAEFEVVSEAPERLTAKIPEEKPQETSVGEGPPSTGTSEAVAENTQVASVAKQETERAANTDLNNPSETKPSDTIAKEGNAPSVVEPSSDRQEAADAGDTSASEETAVSEKVIAEATVPAAEGERKEEASGTTPTEQSTIQSDDEITTASVSSPEKEEVNTAEPAQLSEATASLPAKQYPQSELPEATPVSEDVQTPVPDTLGIKNKNARVILVAQQEAWIQIVDQQGASLFDGVMDIGDTYLVPNQNGVVLNAANAAAMEIRLDGSVLQSLGGYGEIIQGFSLDPENLKSTLSAGQ